MRTATALALIAICPGINAQPPLPRAEFEVASVKPNQSNERMYYGLRNSTLSVRNMSAKGLIQVAFGKRDFQIAGGPAWIASECFDVQAKAGRGQKASHEMEKSLLADRFHLQFHMEMKEAPAYSLVVARSGLKMKRSADQTEPERGGPREMGGGRLIGDAVPFYVITNILSNMLGRTVINETGLTGKFDVDLRILPDAEQSPADPADQLNLALVDAIEKQLGLKLQSVRAPQEILVIDHIERPSAI